MEFQEKRELRQRFLSRWTEANIEKMTLEDYVAVGNRDTFCQWVETITRDLGSIKGFPSTKFGIFKRGPNHEGMPKRMMSDGIYQWGAKFGNTPEEAFLNVKEAILNIIEAIKKEKYEVIDNSPLHTFMKWKVASLYSNEKIIPIFTNACLSAIAQSYGITEKIATSDLQRKMLDLKPPEQDFYDYSDYLWNKYRDGTDKVEDPDSNEGDIIGTDKKRRKRKPTSDRNVDNYIMTTIAQQRIVSRFHKKLQLSLEEKLIIEYPESRVFREENDVDLKVIHSDTIDFYEIKTSNKASECIRQAIGQLLQYVYSEDNSKIGRAHV